MFISKKQYDKLMALIDDQDKQLKRATGLLHAAIDIINRQDRAMKQMSVATKAIEFPDAYETKVKDQLNSFYGKFFKEGGFNS